MQAGILDLEKLESKKDKKMILKKEKLKKERRKEEEARTYESKKGRRRRIVKKSNGKNWFGEYKYIGKDYSRSIIILSLKGLDKRTTLD